MTCVSGDKELVEFLTDEIAAEKKGRKARTLTSLDGFDIKLNGSEMTLSKKFNDEMYKTTFIISIICVKFNNHFIYFLVWS